MVKHILKSTRQRIFLLEHTGQGLPPYPSDYERVLIPNENGAHHIQIVNRRNIESVKLTFTEAA